MRVRGRVARSGRRFWLRAIDFEYLLAEEMIDERDRGLFSLAETAQEAWETILAWYAERGRSIVAPAPAAE